MNCSDRELAMRRLQIADFALIEANLYLDTHPECEKGLEYFRYMRDERNAALGYYEMNYGPITAEAASAEYRWEWVDNPWPWELEA